MTPIRVFSRSLLQSITLLIGLATARGLTRKKRTSMKIGIQLFSVHLAMFLEPLLEALKDDPEIEVVVQLLPHPHFTSTDRKDLVRYLVDSLDLPPESIRRLEDSIWETFDAVFYSDVFARFPPRSRKNILLNHGVGTSRRFTTRKPFRLSAFDFHTVFCASGFDRDSLVKRRPAGNTSEILCTGSVIFDRLNSASTSRTRYLQDLGLDTDKPTVLFAPHWSRLRQLDMELIDDLEAIMETLCSLDLNVVVKLHEMSYRIDANGGRDWSKEVQRWQLAGISSVDRNHDDVPALLHSDVIVTDVSSRGLIFAGLGKPSILYRWGGIDEWQKKSGPLEPDSFELLRSCALTAGSPHELRRAVVDALSAHDSSTQNREIANAGIVPPESPTEVILAYIRRDATLGETESYAASGTFG